MWRAEEASSAAHGVPTVSSTAAREPRRHANIEKAGEIEVHLHVDASSLRSAA